MNAFELNDEQLEMVSGGEGTGNTNTTSIGVSADTVAVGAFQSHVTTYGSIVEIHNTTSQSTSQDNSQRFKLRF
jgi:hypothetical protein